MNHYTDQQRIAALAALEANAGNVKRTARELAIPEATVRLWRNAAEAGGTALALRHAAPVKTDWAAIFEAALLESVAVTRRKLPDASPRDAGIITGILSDKYLDHTQGRKAGVVVDNRSVNLAHLTDAQLVALADGLTQ